MELHYPECTLSHNNIIKHFSSSLLYFLRLPLINLKIGPLERPHPGGVISSLSACRKKGTICYCEVKPAGNWRSKRKTRTLLGRFISVNWETHFRAMFGRQRSSSDGRATPIQPDLNHMHRAESQQAPRSKWMVRRAGLHRKRNFKSYKVEVDCSTHSD